MVGERIREGVDLELESYLYDVQRSDAEAGCMLATLLVSCELDGFVGDGWLPGEETSYGSGRDDLCS
jgi:hypothetical protein